eukprot:2938777-Pleurochrysis_carterae.AAC.1
MRFVLSGGRGTIASTGRMRWRARFYRDQDVVGGERASVDGDRLWSCEGGEPLDARDARLVQVAL